MKKEKKVSSFWRDKGVAVIVVLFIIVVWDLVCRLQVVPVFLVPSPLAVIKALIRDLPALMKHGVITVSEGLVGLLIAVVLGTVLAVLMDFFQLLEVAITPILLFTQTVPTIALAPLLILWLGYGFFPKVILVLITCFFPITIGVLGGFKQVDKDEIVLLRSMGASKRQIYLHLKVPSALPNFFDGLSISASYALISALVSEWLGGNEGLGVYMTRVRKSYAYDKMFAVIIFIGILSMALLYLVKLFERKATPWNQKGD